MKAEELYSDEGTSEGTSAAPMLFHKEPKHGIGHTDGLCVSEGFLIFSKRGHAQLLANASVKISRASRLSAASSSSHGA